MSSKRIEFWLAIFLLIYLFLLGVSAAVGVIVIFPVEGQEGIDGTSAVIEVSHQQRFILLATLAGIAGSFLHTAQSLSSYLGNASFKASWTVWYLLRPWIGGILGFAIYFVLRAGLVSGTGATGTSGGGALNPYGVVALGVLGGWFSKTTTDKLKEVFETLFVTDEDRKRKDKLHSSKRPSIDSIVPSPIPSTSNELKIIGKNFMDGANVLVGMQEVESDFISDEELNILLDKLDKRPSNGSKVVLRVRNPVENKALSEENTVVFE